MFRIVDVTGCRVQKRRQGDSGVSDDIVTRLREEVAKAEVAGVLPHWELAKCMWGAADEIEGLRAENDAFTCVS